MFKNRIEAADILLQKLLKYKGKDTVVAGIPRGAIPMAKYIADHLDAKCTALLVHKISAPENEELAIGCIGLSGYTHSLTHSSYYGIDRSYLDSQAKIQLEKLKQRKKLYSLKDYSFKGKNVIIIDDGIATGATTICAIHEVRSHSPNKIIVATPVSSSEAANEIESLVDEFLVLYIPNVMYSIGQFYESFPQVSDDQVIMNLRDDLSDISKSF